MAKTAKKSSRSRGVNLADAAGKKLVIVESPAKARTINRYLGDDYLVTASMGHVRDLPKRDIGVDIERQFEPTYVAIDARRKVLAELKKAARNAEAVYLATDLDREGEAIAWHLAEELGVAGDRIRRVVFNAITKSAIDEAFSHPRSIEMDRVNAQQARRILDRIVGYQISPLLWKKVASGLSAGRVQSVAVRLIVDREREIDAFMPEEYWNIGAVFTTALADAAGLAGAWQELLAQRDEKNNPPTRDVQRQWLAERDGFRAELTHWRGEKAKLENFEQSREIADALGMTIDEVVRITDDKAKGPAKNLVRLNYRLYGEGTKQLPPFRVTELNERNSRSRPSGPLTTAAMQQAASSQLRFAASRTMRVAQQLYEGVEVPGEGSVGLITYMRTDSMNLSPEAVRMAREQIGKDYGDRYLPEKPNIYAAGGRAQEAHEAIRPTDPSRRPRDLRGVLSDEQHRLYTLIWKRFIACQMVPAEWKVTEAIIVADTSAGEAKFKASGRQLVFDGFLKVAGLPTGAGDQLLPPLEAEQPVAPIDLPTEQKFTQPPSRYTEASLVKALESLGIGRPSTYASIIQTVQDRDYVEQIERKFFPTSLGVKVTDKLTEHFPKIMDVGFTAHMEDQLDQIEDAHLDWVKVLQEFYGPFKQALEAAAENMVHAKAEEEPSEYVCESCGKPMVYKWSKNGQYLACTGYPECTQTHPVDRDGNKVEQKVVANACPECGGDMMVRRSRWGEFLGCLKYPECKGTRKCDAEGNPLQRVKAEDLSATCEQCGSPMEVKTRGRRAFLGCTNYPDCKNTANVPDDVEVILPPKKPPEPTGVTCPKCGKSELVVREGPRGDFVACIGFPKCRFSFNLDKLDDVKAAVEAGKSAEDVMAAAGRGGKAAKTAKKTAKKTTKKKSAKKKAKKKSTKAKTTPDDE